MRVILLVVLFIIFVILAIIGLQSLGYNKLQSIMGMVGVLILVGLILKDMDVL